MHLVPMQQSPEAWKSPRRFNQYQTINTQLFLFLEGVSCRSRPTNSEALLTPYLASASAIWLPSLAVCEYFTMQFLHGVLDSLDIQSIALAESDSIIILFPINSSLVDDSSSALITASSVSLDSFIPTDIENILIST